MNAQTNPIQTGGEITYSIDPALRKRHLTSLCLRTLGICAVVFIGIRAVMDRPLWPVSPWTIGLLALPVLLYWLRSTWGTAIRFELDGITILKHGQITKEIPGQDIQSIDCKNQAIVIRYRIGSGLRIAIVPREGFTDASWAEISALCTKFVSPANS
jgi:hypothetical protein